MAQSFHLPFGAHQVINNVMRTVFLAILSTCLLLGCESNESSAANNDEAPETSSPVTSTEEERWEVKLSVSGGFAGRQNSITINSQGKVIHAQRGQPNPEMSQLQENQIKALNAAVKNYLQDSTSGVNADLNSNRGCADCIQFTLTITPASGKALSTSWNSMSPAEQRPQLAELIQEYGQPADKQ